jgi:hypothetical protein
MVGKEISLRLSSRALDKGHPRTKPLVQSKDLLLVVSKLLLRLVLGGREMALLKSTDKLTGTSKAHLKGQ